MTPCTFDAAPCAPRWFNSPRASMAGQTPAPAWSLSRAAGAPAMPAAPQHGEPREAGHGSSLGTAIGGNSDPVGTVVSGLAAY